MRLYCIPRCKLPTGWESYGFPIKAQIDHALTDMENQINLATFTVNKEGYHVYRSKNFYLEIGEQHATLELFSSSGSITVEYRTFKTIDNSRVPPPIVSAFMAQVPRAVLLWNLMQ